MRFPWDKSQAGGFIGVLKYCFHSRQPQICKYLENQDGFNKTKGNSGQLAINKLKSVEWLGSYNVGFILDNQTTEI